MKAAAKGRKNQKRSNIAKGKNHRTKKTNKTKTSKTTSSNQPKETKKNNKITLEAEAKPQTEGHQRAFFTSCSPPNGLLKRKSRKPNIRKRGGVQKSMDHKVPWETGILICHPVTSRPLIFPQKEQFHLLVTSRPPIGQLAFWHFISLELRDPWNGGPFRNAP